MSRGNARLPIFRDAADKELLLDRMVHFAEIFRIEIRAYCVMINHYHVHVHTREANLGAYMRSFLTSFTSMYNHRHGSCGHVFQGRYKAFLLEDEKPFVAKVTGYIHLNPVRIPSLADKPLDERHDAALRYPWSSYGQIMGFRRCPDWLDRDAVLSGWGRNLAEKRKGYRASVESSLLADITDPMEEAAAQAVLGSEEFVDRVKRGLKDLRDNVNVRRESTQRRRLDSWRDLEEVVAAVSGAYECEPSSLLGRYSRGCEGRQVLLYLAARKCRGRYSLSEIAEHLGPLTITGLSSARTKMAGQLRTEPDLRKRVADIEKALDDGAYKSKS